MSENRLPDYLDHIQQAAIDACSFVEGLTKGEGCCLTAVRTKPAP